MRTEPFHWSSGFDAGLQEIDARHEEAVGLLNRLHATIQNHHGSATSRRILDKLADCTRTRFAVEEAMKQREWRWTFW